MYIQYGIQNSKKSWKSGNRTKIKPQNRNLAYRGKFPIKLGLIRKNPAAGRPRNGPNPGRTLPTHPQIGPNWTWWSGSLWKIVNLGPKVTKIDDKIVQQCPKWPTVGLEKVFKKSGKHRLRD